jgi:hypothetical protein
MFEPVLNIIDSHQLHVSYAGGRGTNGAMCWGVQTVGGCLLPLTFIYLCQLRERRIFARGKGLPAANTSLFAACRSDLLVHDLVVMLVAVGSQALAESGPLLMIM